MRVLSGLCSLTTRRSLTPHIGWDTYSGGCMSSSRLGLRPPPPRPGPAAWNPTAVSPRPGVADYSELTASVIRLRKSDARENSIWTGDDGAVPCHRCPARSGSTSHMTRPPTDEIGIVSGTHGDEHAPWQPHLPLGLLHLLQPSPFLVLLRLFPSIPSSFRDRRDRGEFDPWITIAARYSPSG